MDERDYQAMNKQPKSESRMYSEDEMRCSFDAGYDYRTSLNDDIIIEFGKDSAQTFKSFIQSIQPKTEEVERGWTITDAKEQPTSPSIEFRNELNNYGKEVYDKGYIEGYKANNHLDDLEKYIKEYSFSASDDGGIFYKEVVDIPSLLKFLQANKSK